MPIITTKINHTLKYDKNNFSFENIKEFNGPMEVKLFDKLNNKEKI